MGRVWVTRRRPGIDRSASAWLIWRFIDKKARFTFAPEEHVPRKAVPFDMFRGGFGHRGEDCTFETLQKTFRIRDKEVGMIGQIIHDADLLDERFGRKECFGVDEDLNGWAKQGMPDNDLLERGIQLIEALYQSVAGKYFRWMSSSFFRRVAMKRILGILAATVAVSALIWVIL